MATQQANIAAAFLRVVQSANTLSANIGDLSSLTTTNKANIVAALEEVKGLIPTLSSVIDDAKTQNTTTWSSTKIQAQITAAITALISGAPEAQNTLGELAAQITALSQTDAGLLSFDAAQTLTADQKLQGCNNLGIGDPAHNYVTAIEASLNTGL